MLMVIEAKRYLDFVMLVVLLMYVDGPQNGTTIEKTTPHMCGNGNN